jgi:hypothetical protein
MYLFYLILFYFINFFKLNMIIDYSILIIIGFIWGATNYLIELYYYDYDHIKEFSFPMKIIYFIRKNYLPLIFFIMNQSASILFYFSLSKISLSTTVVITNSISFITTLLFERIHKRKYLTKSKYFYLNYINKNLNIY